MKDGDIFTWTFKGDNIDYGSYGSYHCYSQKAVFENGRLYDTYWSSGGRCRALDPAKVNLTYRGNKHEMTEIREDEARFYRPKDVVDMRHANASRAPIYIQPGATRDAATMRELIQSKIERETATIKSSHRYIERLEEDLEKTKRSEESRVGE